MTCSCHKIDILMAFQRRSGKASVKIVVPFVLLHDVDDGWSNKTSINLTVVGFLIRIVTAVLIEMQFSFDSYTELS